MFVVGEHGLGLERLLEAAYGPLAEDGNGVVAEAVVAEAGEVLGGRVPSIFWRKRIAQAVWKASQAAWVG